MMMMMMMMILGCRCCSSDGLPRPWQMRESPFCLIDLQAEFELEWGCLKLIPKYFVGCVNWWLTLRCFDWFLVSCNGAMTFNWLSIRLKEYLRYNCSLENPMRKAAEFWQFFQATNCFPRSVRQNSKNSLKCLIECCRALCLRRCRQMAKRLWAK